MLLEQGCWCICLLNNTKRLYECPELDMNIELRYFVLETPFNVKKEPAATILVRGTIAISYRILKNSCLMSHQFCQNKS
jgi:hypothetical protein